MKEETSKPVRLSKDILFFPSHGNITVLNLGAKSLMIDCGRKEAEVREIRKEAESLFKNKIEYVVLTHFHSDHTHGLPLFANSQILASEQLVKFLKAAKRSSKIPFVYPNTVFEEEYTFTEGEFEISVKQTGGHTPDSSHVYSPGHKLLAAGDNLRSDHLWGARKSDPEKWIAALEEYVSLDVDHVITGHGEIMTREEVKAVLEHVLEMKARIVELLEEGKEEGEIITKAKAVKPRGESGVYIHDDTVTKWYKFWKREKRTVSGRA